MARNINEKMDGDIYSKKLIFIYGKSPVLGKNLNGKCEVIDKTEGDSKFTSHAEYFRNYIRENLSEDKNMSSIAERKEISTMLFLMQRMGHIAFAESTSKNHSKFGIIFMPKKVTDEQKEALKDLQQKLNEEKYQVNVVHDLCLDEYGCISGKTKIGTPEILDKFIEKEKDVDER